MPQRLLESLDLVHRCARVKPRSLRTERAHVSIIERFFLVHRERPLGKVHRPKMAYPFTEAASGRSKKSLRAERPSHTLPLPRLAGVAQC